MQEKIYLSVSLLLLFVPLVASAVNFNQDVSPEDEATFDQILEPVLKIYNFIKYVATAIAGLMLLFAGITYVVSGSDMKKRDDAKNIAMYVIIGLIVIWAAPLIVEFIIG